MDLKIWKKKNNFASFLAVFFISLLVFLAFSSSVSAEFIKGNKTAEIQAEYSPSEAIKGWINISLKNESVNSQLSTSFEDSISLINILQKNNLLQSVNCNNATCSSSNKFVKIELDSVEFKVPSVYGNYTLRIMLAGNDIAVQNIAVSKIPVIKSVSPTIVPAGAISDFVVSASSPENLSFAEYTWDFGDGSAIVKTTANKASHTYANANQYALKITIKDSSGKAASQEFAINAVSPAGYANETINEKRKLIQNISNALLLYPEWQRDFIAERLNITDIDSQLTILQQAYNSATTTEQYTDIMKKLVVLKAPKKLSGLIASDIKFSVVPNSIDMEKLKSAGAGDYKADKSDEYKNAIAAWFAEKTDSSLSFEVISAEFDNKESSDIATNIKLRIKPKETLKDVYFIVKKSPNNIKFKDTNAKDINGGMAIVFSELNANTNKDIELIASGGMAIDEIFNSIFISPKLNELNLDLQIEPCNFNNVCEKSLGETWKNCRKDCKPIGFVILYIVLVFVAAFIAYIILQEWYKKNYESSLFKNKNDLYNLLAFIENANKQGLKESGIIKKLKEAKWSGEQIAYAIKKYKGKRVGMWEIPLFKGAENKKVKEEIARRITSTASTKPQFS